MLDVNMFDQLKIGLAFQQEQEVLASNTRIRASGNRPGRPRAGYRMVS